jgi:hypothetical protein
MRKTLLAALAAAALLTAAMLCNRAEAMTLASPSTLNGSVAGAGLVHKAAVVCGYRGCVRVWPRRLYAYGYRRPYGYYGRRW